MGFEIFGDIFDGPAAVFQAAVEILILAYLFYRLAQVIRGTRAVPVLLGLVMLSGLYLLAEPLGLHSIHWLLGMAAPYALLAFLVIFQQEVRRVLRDIALQFAPSRPQEKPRYQYEDVVYAVEKLSANRVGTLIVLGRNTGLRTFIQSGVALDARLSSDLLISIFQRWSPLHDGAVIIERGKIAAAACFLPLTTDPSVDPSFGTRHRAAIGITEDSDSLAIVVAEASGTISVAAGGGIGSVTIDGLREQLIKHFGPVVSEPVPHREPANREVLPAPPEPLTYPEPAAADEESKVS